MRWIDFLPCLYAFIACIGFCMIFNVRSPGSIICSLGGALGWLIYLLMNHANGSVYLSAFIASVIISIYSEVMARIRKYPVTGYLLVSIIPLVPGAGIYHTMEYGIAGDSQLFLSKGLETVGIAGALAIGVLLVSSACRRYKGPKKRIHD
jgi:uncharacterized membrane protein YjjB (DUF3815 family)